MSELVIEFGEQGTVKAMHSDKFDLGFLGDKKVRRQTEIAFNDTTQKWNIEYIENGVAIPHESVAGFSGYEEARMFEVAWLNACRLNSISPASEQGFRFASWMRSNTCEKHNPVS